MKGAGTWTFSINWKVNTKAFCSNHRLITFEIFPSDTPGEEVVRDFSLKGPILNQEIPLQLSCTQSPHEEASLLLEKDSQTNS